MKRFLYFISFVSLVISPLAQSPPNPVEAKFVYQGTGSSYQLKREQ
jgi:hypothetical protein